MNKENTCPECGSRYHQDFVRCPNCHAYIVDADPWHGAFNLLAIPLALGIWWLLEWLLAQPWMITNKLFDDWISSTILGIGIYGIIILLFKWRVLAKQAESFHIVRRVCASTNGSLGEGNLNEARDLIDAASLGPYNNFIAFHRLRWMVSATRVGPQDRQGLLEALRQHSESDWDSLESSYSFTQFLIWLLPSAGFLGTVWGMSQALSSFSGVVDKGNLDFNAGLTATAQNLGIAFHTTLIGLAAVIPLLALATYMRRRSQGLLEQMDKFFLRLAAHTLFHSEVEPPESVNPIFTRHREPPPLPTDSLIDLSDEAPGEEPDDDRNVGEADAPPEALADGQDEDREELGDDENEAPTAPERRQVDAAENLELWDEDSSDHHSPKGTF